MFYATYNTSGRSSTLESTTYYYCNDFSYVTRVVTDKGDTGLAFGQSHRPIVLIENLSTRFDAEAMIDRGR